MANTIRNKRGTTKPAASDLVTGEIAVKTDDAKLFIENDSGYVFEVGETLGTFSSSTITYTVTVASKTSAHRYNGTGSSNGYKINGIFSPFLSLTAGNTYKFDQSDSSNGGHPLRFYLEADKTTAYTTNVTTNGTAGSSGAYTQIVITDATPIILHYQCSAHAYMGNSVTSNGTSIDGSNITSGTIPDARFPATLPAVSGANLTNLPSGGLSSDAQMNTVGGTNAGDSFTGTDANGNTLIGYDAGTAITSGDYNTAFGQKALYSTTTASYNVAIGPSALYQNQTGTQNMAMGDQAGYNVTGSRNVMIGHQASTGGSAGATAISDVIAIGYRAGYVNESGNNQVFIGRSAGESVTTGGLNTLIGYQAGKSMTTAAQSTIVGYQAGDAITTGNYNVLMGAGAGGGLTTAQRNTFLGYYVGNAATTAGYNVGIGSNAFESLSSGEFNIGIGYQAADNITSGSSNTCVGQYSGNTLTTGSNNTCLGNNAVPSAVDVSNEITLGNSSVTKFRIPGLNFVVKDSTATNGHVLTVDANGEAGFAAAGGGGGFEFVSKSEVTSGNTAAYIEFTSLENDTLYRLVAKQVVITANTGYLEFQFKDTSGNLLNSKLNYTRHYGATSSITQGFTSQNKFYGAGISDTSKTSAFILEFFTKPGNVWFYLNAQTTTGTRAFIQTWGSFVSDDTTTQVGGIRISDANGSGYTMDPGTQVLLYKYKES